MMTRILSAFFALVFSMSFAFADEGRGRLGVFPAPPSLIVKVAFSEPSGNNILDADETGKLSITIDNSGKGDAFDVTAEISAEGAPSGLGFDKSVSIGTVPAGGKTTKELELRAAEEIPASNVKFHISVKEANGFEPAPLILSFKTKAFDPPKLVLADMAINDQNHNSRVEQMEMVELTARVQNIGYGDARGVRVDVVMGDNVFIGGDAATRFELGGIPAGKFKDVKFMFYTNTRIKDGENIPIRLVINEARPQFKSEKPLSLAMNAAQKRAEEIIVKGMDDGPKGEITVAGGLSVDVEQNLPRASAVNKDAVAVVIGNRDYEKTKSVEFAINDAEAVRLYLTEVLGFKDGNIIFVKNAKKGDFETVFGNEKNHKGKLFSYVKPNVSDVFVYYSGHGAPGLTDKKGYFVPVEADPQHVELGGYPAEVMYNNLSKIPAKSMTVVLDACFSGAQLFKNVSPMTIEITNPVLRMNNAVVLSSSQGSEVSSWYNEKKHGMFTYFFLKAIHNKNGDANKDNVLTFDEIFRFVSDGADGVPYYARRNNSVEQHPTMEGQNKGKALVVYR